jgi:hypothetical protein
MKRIKFVRESDKTYHQGYIFCHSVSKSTAPKSVIACIILATLFADNKAALFPSRKYLCKGLLLLQELFTRLGIEMHIREKRLDKKTNEVEWKASKTECVFFPPPCFFKPLMTNR